MCEAGTILQLEKKSDNIHLSLLPSWGCQVASSLPLLLSLLLFPKGLHPKTGSQNSILLPQIDFGECFTIATEKKLGH